MTFRTRSAKRSSDRFGSSALTSGGFLSAPELGLGFFFSLMKESESRKRDFAEGRRVALRDSKTGRILGTRRVA